MKAAVRTASGSWPILLALAILQLAWLGWFAREPLPSVGAVAGGRGVTRLGLLVRSIPEVVPGLKYHDSHLGIALGNLGHFENLPARLPIVLAAGFIVASAVAAGRLVLRGLGLLAGFDRAERLALGFGLGTTVLGLATLVAGRVGLLGPGFVRSGLLVPIVAELGMLAMGRRGPKRIEAGGPKPGPLAWLGFATVTGPFLLILFLGAMLPCIDFDGLEYHLQGPKEYYQAGRVGFLPHNVYTSMPFGVEMLHLIGMEVVDDWWLGALVGQVVVAGFAPASAGLVAMATRRVGSPRAAWVAGVVYLTTPWVYRLGVLPLVEGPLCYFHAALIYVVARASCRDSAIGPARLGGLVGLLAGGAMAIKYPALISAVIPAAGWAGVAAWRARSWRLAVGFAAGLAVVMGPWLGKNVLDTGNPVYPLGYSVFGGRHWTPARDARWSAAHGPKPVEAAALVGSVLDVAGRSDWQSPMFAALAPLALLRPGSRAAARWLWGFSAYVFLTWWLFTHRLDRFWLPILPTLAILAGLGADWCRSRAWTAWLAILLASGIGANLVFCSTELAGLNDWTGDLAGLRASVPRLLNPALARLDAELPSGARPLMIGQAGVFHVGHRVAYNTVFDEDVFESLARGRSPGEVRDALGRLGITHLYVDWSEIERYRSPGNYGFTPFVTPGVFEGLVRAGVLSPPSKPGPKQELYGVRPAPGLGSIGRGDRMDGSTVVVTGGAGFIGSHLVRQLAGQGRRVRVVERPGAPVGHLPGGVEVVFADIRDPEATTRAVSGARWVYHLAANPNLWARDRGEFDAVNHRGTVHVLDAALAGGAERVVHVSTESILTRARSTGPIAEDVEVRPSDAVGPYCLSKLRAEEQAMARARAGAPVVVVNPTMPVGPGDRGVSPPTRLIRDFCAGGLPARMDCTLNLVDVRDVAEGLVRAMDRGVPGRRYLLGGENLTLVGMLGILSDLTGVPVPRWVVPYPVGLAVAWASEIRADWLTGRPPKATVTGVRLTRRTMHFDASRSLAALGLEPRPVRQSLADAVAWLRDRGDLPDRPRRPKSHPSSLVGAPGR